MYWLFCVGFIHPPGNSIYPWLDVIVQCTSNWSSRFLNSPPQTTLMSLDCLLKVADGSVDVFTLQNISDSASGSFTIHFSNSIKGYSSTSTSSTPEVFGEHLLLLIQLSQFAFYLFVGTRSTQFVNEHVHHSKLSLRLVFMTVFYFFAPQLHWITRSTFSVANRKTQRNLKLHCQELKFGYRLCP